MDIAEILSKEGIMFKDRFFRFLLKRCILFDYKHISRVAQTIRTRTEDAQMLLRAVMHLIFPDDNFENGWKILPYYPTISKFFPSLVSCILYKRTQSTFFFFFIITLSGTCILPQ